MSKLHSAENENVLRHIARMFALSGSEWEYTLWSTVCTLAPNSHIRKVVTRIRPDSDIRPDLLGYLANAKDYYRERFQSDYNQLGDPLAFWTKYTGHLAHRIAQEICRTAPASTFNRFA